MPFLSTDKFGAGPLYDFSTADRSAYLTQGTTYFQTSASGWAIQQDVFDSTFVCAGEIGSNGVGIRVSTNDGSRIDVTASGYLSTIGEAILILSTGTFLVTNAGFIAADADAIVVDTPGGEVRVVNSGTIRAPGHDAIHGGDGQNRVVNTGTIIGNIRFGAAFDSFDTHLGVFSGTISGGDGGDSYNIAGTERIDEFANNGFDSVTSHGDFTLPINVEALNLAGLARNGWGNAGDNQITAAPHDSNLFGRDGDDILVGAAGDDELRGGRGDDYVLDKDGDDRIFGGAGDDRVDASLGDDRIDGGAGRDQIKYSDSREAVTIDLGAGTGLGGLAEGDVLTNVEDVLGTGYDDRITGNGAANAFTGYAGDDRLSGGGGDDVLLGGIGGDVLDGGGGGDTADYRGSAAVTIDLGGGTATGGDATGDVLISIENIIGSFVGDTIAGSNGANGLHGSFGDDALRGGSGSDTLFGDAGDDSLYGQNGADVFAFADVSTGSPGGWDADLVQDFVDGVDRISFVGASAIHSISDLSLSVAGDDVVITTGVAGDVIRLVGFDPGDLDASDFIFAPAAQRLRFDLGERIDAAVSEFAALP